MSKKDWVWMPHAGHLIVGSDCRFHLSTYLGNGYMVSTVGEWWPDRQVREIHANIHDPEWYAENVKLLGDSFDHAYMQRFGFEEIGMNRKYETMVFKAEPAKHDPDYDCCPWTASDWSGVDFDGYNTATSAYRGHMAMCEKWAKKRKGGVSVKD